VYFPHAIFWRICAGGIPYTARKDSLEGNVFSSHIVHAQKDCWRYIASCAITSRRPYRQSPCSSFKLKCYYPFITINYYIHKSGQRSGPFPEEQLKQLLSSGMASSSDLCWREGLSEWIPLSQVIDLSPPQVTPIAQPTHFAGFWRRVGANVIDTTILQAGCFIIVFSLEFSLVSLGAEKNLSAVICYIVAIVCIWLYYELFESSKMQGTLGKRACCFVVTDLDGRRISFGRASGRFWGMILSYLTIFIGFFMCGWTKKKQCLHDMISNCVMPMKW
jgi:uncharacterized RDD family membrane protein YckC